MGQLNVTFTPFVKDEHSMVVVINNLEKVPTQQEFIGAYFKAIAGIKDNVVENAPIEQKPDLDALKKSTETEEESESSYKILSEVAETNSDDKISNPEMFKKIAKAYLDGVYEGPEKDAIKKEIFGFLKEEFGKIRDISYYVEIMTEDEINEFFDVYTIAIGEKTKKMALKKGYSSWQEFLEKGTLDDKRVVIERVMKVYA